MYLILFVLHDAEKLEELLDAWERVGVSGVTILHSTGLGRIRTDGFMDDIPLFPSLESILRHDEEINFSRTLFTVVADDEMVNKVVQATQSLVGDLSKPDTGLLVVLPVHHAYGLVKKSLPSKPE
jgi:nitrogen regulatory protein PII